jgi:hypothetical protein
MSAPQISQHQHRGNQIRDEYLGPRHAAECTVCESGRNHVEPHGHYDEGDQQSGEDAGRARGLVHHHRQKNSDQNEREIMKNRVGSNVDKRRVRHRSLSKDADQAGAEEIGSIKWTSANAVDNQEPQCDCGRPDESSDHAFAQKIVLPLSHSYS